MPRRYHVIMNPHSGTVLAAGLTPANLQERFEAAGLQAFVDADESTSLDQKLERARQSDADVVVAAGGDGTVTSVAQAILGTDKSLAILPLGTVNLLARDLGIPLDLDSWITALDQMEPRRMDVGEVNGRIFLHKVVVGVIPGIAAGREAVREHFDWAAKIALLRFFHRRLARARRMAVEITGADGRARIVRVAALAVGNNLYDEGLGRFFSRKRLDGGHLSLYLLKHLNLGDVLRLASEMFIGRWRNDDAIEVETVRSVTIRTRRAKLRVMFDGDIILLDVPLDFRVRPLALSIMAPTTATNVAPIEEPAIGGTVVGVEA